MTRVLSPNESNSTGTPRGGGPAYLAVGRLRKPHGIHGEIAMEVLTDFPERLRPGEKVLVGPAYVEYKIHTKRWHNQMMLITFKNITTPEEAGELRNQMVYVRTDDVPELEEGEYYHHQLIGLRLYSENDRLLGQVSEILETGSNDVLVIRPEAGSEVLVPFVQENLLEVNLELGVIRMKIIPGLLEDEP